MSTALALMFSLSFGGLWFSIFFFGPGIYNYFALRRMKK